MITWESGPLRINSAISVTGKNCHSKLKYNSLKLKDCTLQYFSIAAAVTIVVVVVVVEDILSLSHLSSGDIREKKIH